MADTVSKALNEMMMAGFGPLSASRPSVARSVERRARLARADPRPPAPTTRMTTRERPALLQPTQRRPSRRVDRSSSPTTRPVGASTTTTSTMSAPIESPTRRLPPAKRFHRPRSPSGDDSGEEHVRAADARRPDPRPDGAQPASTRGRLRHRCRRLDDELEAVDVDARLPGRAQRPRRDRDDRDRQRLGRDESRSTS